MYQNAVIPPVEPESRLFNSGCNPHNMLDSRFTLRCAAFREANKVKGFTLRCYSKLTLCPLSVTPEGCNPGSTDSVSESTKKGFTLIELLVVVLIIGILSSVALPQYTRAVGKARTAPLRLALAEVKRAEQEYKLANGEMPSSVADMADFLEMPQRPDGSFGRGNFQVGLSTDSYTVHYLTALFAEGPYAGSGLAYVYYSRALAGITDCVICYENTSKQGVFCEKLFGATHIRNTYGVRFYKLPDSQCN